jgi:hypothetical protein
LVLQNASVLAGRKWFSSRLTACRRSLSLTSYQRCSILRLVLASTLMVTGLAHELLA